MHDDTLKNRLQERFEGYSSMPSEDVWEGIESALNEDEKRRVLFWWFSPLGLSILAGTSAAALAIFFWIPSKHTIEDFPPIDSIRSANAVMEKHVIQNDPQIEAPLLFQSQSPTPTYTPTPVYSTALPNFRFELPPYPLLHGSTAKIEYTSIELVDSNFQNVPAHNEKVNVQRRWELHCTATGFMRSESTSSIGTSSPDNNSGTSMLESGSETNIPQRHQRFGEFEVSGIGYFSRRLKAGIGLSVAYSDEEGRIDEQTQFATTQWTIGIPVQLGIDLLQSKRFELSVVTKFLNDWEFRKSELLTDAEYTPITSIDPTANLYAPNPPVIIEKGTAYRFGIQPTFVASFAIKPQLALSVGIGYRAYIAESRNPSVNFEKTNYGTLSIGLVKRW